MVLNAYEQTHSDVQDLAIEMPTGEGKTLVALLIADAALDEGKSVAYLTGTRQLANHVVDEAKDLGLEVVKFSGGNYPGRALDDYHQAQAVGVMNYWVYFNTSPVPAPADLIIFDDAHLAEQSLTGLQMLRIPRGSATGSELYTTLCDLVLAHTDAYASLSAMRDGEALPGTPPELLAFNDWAAIADAASAAIRSSGFFEESDARYMWIDLEPRLKRSGVLIGPSAIEIGPYHPPTTSNAWYARSKQRIFLSATLGSMDDLQRRIGGNTVKRLTPDGPAPKGNTGDRLFVLNPANLPALDPRTIDLAMQQVPSAGGRAAWLCSSHAEADAVEEILSALGEMTFRLRGGDDTAIRKWEEADRGHLVTAGRYDGLDLEGQICNLVVLPSVPQASSEFERFVVAYLGDASFMRHRVGQRVTQALGRANRRPDDRAIYVGLDPQFAQILAHPSVRKSITPNAAPSVRGALLLHGEGPQATLAACRAFWDGEDTLRELAEEATESRKQRPGRSTGGIADVRSAEFEVKAATDLWLGAFADAATAAREASERLAEAGEIEHSAFWRYVEAHAHFSRSRPADLASAHKALEEVISKGPRTAWFLRLARTADELAGEVPRNASELDSLFMVWDEWLRTRGERVSREIANARASLRGTHDEICEALVVMGRLCGVRSERPPKSESSATDCLWAWNSRTQGERRVWEVKTGGSEKIPRKDVNQLLGQIEVEQKRANRSRVFGCLVSPLDEPADDAADAARDRIALFHQSAIIRLFEVLSDRLSRYIELSADGRAESRGLARETVEPMLPAAGWLERILAPSQGRVVRAEDIDREIPRV